MYDTFSEQNQQSPNVGIAGGEKLHTKLKRTSTATKNSILSPLRTLGFDGHWPFQLPKAKEYTHLRIFDRKGGFFQSHGKVNVRKLIERKDWRALYRLDWFHSLIDSPTPRIVMLLMIVYLAVILFFAVLYYFESKLLDCNLGIEVMVEAFVFSLETMATIGYGTGTGDIYFNDCMIPIGTLTVQVCLKLVVDAIAIGVIYCRLARPNARASTIIFTDKAVIRRIRGKLYFMFQICELRKHQIVEAHIRLYAIRHEVEPGIENNDLRCSSDDGSDDSEAEAVDDESLLSGSYQSQSSTQKKKHRVFMQTSAMRLNHPNDELNGMLLLMLPQVIVHEIDESSPFMPPPLWYTTSGEDVQWRPPVFEKYVDYAVNGSQDQRHPSYVPFYDTRELGRLEFPNVIRRNNNEYRKGISEVYDNSATPLKIPVPLDKLENTQGVRNSNSIGTGLNNLRDGFSRTKSERFLANQPLLGINADTAKNAAFSFQSNGTNSLRPGMTPARSIYVSPGQAEFASSMSRHTYNDANENLQQKRDRAAAKVEMRKWQDLEKQMVQQYMLDRQIEIFAIVEGSDSATGGNVQARHSYTPSDIEWDKTFEECLFQDPDDGCTTIDFGLFHDLVDAPKDAAYSGCISSSI